MPSLVATPVLQQRKPCAPLAFWVGSRTRHADASWVEAARAPLWLSRREDGGAWLAGSLEPFVRVSFFGAAFFPSFFGRWREGQRRRSKPAEEEKRRSYSG